MTDESPNEPFQLDPVLVELTGQLNGLTFLHDVRS